MKKKTCLFILIPILLIGSYTAFYAFNLLASDVSNMFYESIKIDFASSIPLFIISIDFAVGFMFVIKYYRYENRRKSLINLYTIYLAVNSFVAIVFCFITGICVYHSFIKPYPFNGYTIVMLVTNSALLFIGVYLNIYSRKNTKDDPEKKMIKFKHFVYNAIMGLLLYFSFYKLGIILWLPKYVHLRTLYLTIPFYFWSLLPLGYIFHIVFYFLDYYKSYNDALKFLIILFALNIIFGITTIFLGYNFTLFISAISPCLPLERLATSPFDTIITFVLLFISGTYYIIYTIRSTFDLND